MFVPKPRGFPNQMIYPKLSQLQNSWIWISQPPTPLFHCRSPVCFTTHQVLTQQHQLQCLLWPTLKLNSYCKDCNKLGHWKGDAPCQFAALRLAGYKLHN
jgi:hypothetical protein